MKHIVTDEKSAVKYIEMILKDWEVWQTHHTGLVEAIKILLVTNEKLTEENKKLRNPGEVAREIIDEMDYALHDMSMEYHNAGHPEYFAVCEMVHHKVIRPIEKKYTEEKQ